MSPQIGAGKPKLRSAWDVKVARRLPSRSPPPT